MSERAKARRASDSLARSSRLPSVDGGALRKEAASIYEDPAELADAEIREDLASGDPGRIIRALFSVALYGDDPQGGLTHVLAFVDHADVGVRRTASTCIGHLARIHRTLDLERAIPALRLLLADPETEGYADDALGDISIFVDRSIRTKVRRTGRRRSSGQERRASA